MSITSHGSHSVCGEYLEMCGRSIGCCLLHSGSRFMAFNFSLYLHFYWCIVDLCRFMGFWMSNPFSYQISFKFCPGYTDSFKEVEGHVSPQIPELYACGRENGDDSVLLPLWSLPKAIFMMTLYLLCWRLLGFFIPFLWLLYGLYISCFFRAQVGHHLDLPSPLASSWHFGSVAHPTADHLEENPSFSS